MLIAGLINTAGSLVCLLFNRTVPTFTRERWDSQFSLPLLGWSFQLFEDMITATLLLNLYCFTMHVLLKFGCFRLDSRHLHVFLFQRFLSQWFIGLDGYLCSAVLLPFLETDIVLDQKMDKFRLVVLSEVCELYSLRILFFSHYLYSTNGQYTKRLSFKNFFHAWKNAVFLFKSGLAIFILRVGWLLLFGQFFKYFPLLVAYLSWNGNFKEGNMISSRLQ